MTTKEYKEYQETVESFFENEGIDNLSSVSSCEACGNELEPSFAWSSCQCCNSHLGGDRYTANSWRETKTAEVTLSKVFRLLGSVIYLLMSVISEKTLGSNASKIQKSLRKIEKSSILPGTIEEYEVCQDCLYYAEYGELDDMTMMDMEEEEEDGRIIK